MRVRNSFYFGIAVLLCVPLVYFIIDLTHFKIVSVETTGEVQQVMGRNDRCGRKRRRHDCTKFTAAIRYEVRGSGYMINVGAGRVRGHDQPVSLANYVVGQHEFIAYDPNRPVRAYRNTLWDIWGAPFMTFFLQICAFIGSLQDKRKNIE